MQFCPLYQIFTDKIADNNADLCALRGKKCKKIVVYPKMSTIFSKIVRKSCEQVFNKPWTKSHEEVVLKWTQSCASQIGSVYVVSSGLDLTDFGSGGWGWVGGGMVDGIKAQPSWGLAELGKNKFKLLGFQHFDEHSSVYLCIDCKEYQWKFCVLLSNS